MTDLVHIAAAMQFTPSNSQIRHRNAFWANAGLQLPPECSVEAAMALAPSKAVSRCIGSNWATPGFSEWFLNPQWEQEETQRLLHLGMRRVAEILVNSEDDDMLLKAAKEARELHTKLSATNEDKKKYSDQAVQEMTPDELRDFIRKNTAAVNK